jgi:hypothetical protein
MNTQKDMISIKLGQNLMYRLDEDGELKPTTFDRKELKSETVLLITDENARTIWIWKGKNIGVRAKFLSARAAVYLNNQKGRIFKTQSIDEGHEPEEFLSLFNDSKAQKPLSRELSTSATEKPKKVTPDPITPFIERVEEPKFKETSPPQKMRSTGTSFIQENKESPSELILKLEEITSLFGDPPEGFERDYIVIGSDVYGLVVSKSKFLGTTKLDTNYQKLTDIKDGHFVAEGYCSRVLIENSKVKAIEFISKKHETEKEADLSLDIKTLKDELLSGTAKDEDEEPLIVYINPLFSNK